MPKRPAAGLITWQFALYVLVLGFISVLLVPLSSLWWIVPVLGAIVPIVLTVLGRAEPWPERRNGAEAPPSGVLHAQPEQAQQTTDPGGLRATGEAIGVPSAATARATDSRPLVALDDPLSEREREVLAVLASGRTTSETARDLFVSVGTIKSHTANIYRKLGARNRAEAIARARELGLLP